MKYTNYMSVDVKGIWNSWLVERQTLNCKVMSLIPSRGKGIFLLELVCVQIL